MLFILLEVSKFFVVCFLFTLESTREFPIYKPGMELFCPFKKCSMKQLECIGVVYLYIWRVFWHVVCGVGST